VVDQLELRTETDALVKSAYYALRVDNLSKDQSQELEQYLSTQICISEEAIRKGKQDKLDDLTEEMYRRRTILKRIADGLAWKIFDYNAEALNGCSIGHSSGFMAGKSGYQYERNVVEALYNSPNIRYAIQCDITNILRLSDIMAIQTNGQIIPIEVKGSPSGRSSRQKRRVNEIMEFLRTGVFEDAIKWMAPLQSHKVPVVFEHFWDELEGLSRRALKDGMAWSVIDHCLILQVVNTQADIDQDSIENMIKAVNWGNATRTISSLGRHLSRDIDIMPRTRLPLTVFPLSLEMGLEYVLGHLDAVIILNKAAIVDRIRESGLECLLNEDGSATAFTRGGIKFQILDAWDKMLSELVTASSFIGYISATAEKVDSDFSQKMGPYHE
jgi:Holliday junction resolvase